MANQGGSNMADSDDTPGMPAVHFYKPSAPLADFITSFYVVEASRPLVDHLHPEWANIRLVLSGLWRTCPVDAPPDPVRVATIFGPTDRTRRVEASHGVMIGIGLTPLGWLRLTGADARSYANRVADLAEIFGPGAADIIPALVALPDEPARIAHLTSRFESRIGVACPEDALVRAIHAEIVATHYSSVAALVEKLEISERSLHRACLRSFGFSAKRLLRRQRFLRALDAVSNQLDQPLSQIFGDEYYDQSHFNREFRRYMGMTPMAYFRSPRETLRRAAIERQRLIGGSLQGLHAPRP